jgi:hypothetical protein
MRLGKHLVFAALMIAVMMVRGARADDKIKALIIDGQNNHDWRATTPILKWILEDSGRFTVDVSTTPGAPPGQPQRPKGVLTPEQQEKYDDAMTKWRADVKTFKETAAAQWAAWRPKFSDYGVVISNYNGDDWPAEVKAAFVDYLRGGGGLVVVHAADNSFAGWPEYNEMIGLGGWGGRNEKSGPMIRWRDGQMVRDTSPGAGGTHGKQHEFLLEVRAPDHPIMQGLPAAFRAGQDELYAKLRGPAKNLTVLATAFSAPNQAGTNENEPILFVIDYGQGRVFHTTMGHAQPAMYGLAFQVTLARGAEWAATGKVTLPAPKPEDLPDDKAIYRKMPAK